MEMQIKLCAMMTCGLQSPRHAGCLHCRWPEGPQTRLIDFCYALVSRIQSLMLGQRRLAREAYSKKLSVKEKSSVVSKAT